LATVVLRRRFRRDIANVISGIIALRSTSVCPLANVWTEEGGAEPMNHTGKVKFGLLSPEWFMDWRRTAIHDRGWVR